MKRYVFLCCLGFTFGAAAQESFINNAKDAVQSYTRISDVDWYNKGDTAFADYEGMSAGVYQRIKVSTRNDEINLKMDFLSGPKRPDADQFMQATTSICKLVISELITPKPINKKDSASNWNDDSPASIDEFDFMNAKSIDAVQGKRTQKEVNGWVVNIYREGMLTTCSAKKK